MSSFLLQNERFLELKSLGLVDDDGNWIGGEGSGGASSSVLTADPASPDDDTWWVVREGASPDMTVSLKARIDGETVTIASISR